MSKVSIVLIGALILSHSRTFAQEIVVEASAIDEKKIESSRSITIIDEKEFRMKNPATVADIFRNVPGLQVVRQGGVGQTTSVFIRGARSEDTLVLIDGVESNDAMSPANGFDFSTLSPDHIERIEIYRGPQSVQFGAGALGGVINIVTKSGLNSKKLSFQLESGTYNSNRISVGASKGNARFGYSLGAERNSTDGFSAASKEDGNEEVDGAETILASGKFEWKTSDTASVQATTRYSDARADIDVGGGVGKDDPNNETEGVLFAAGLVGTDRYFEESLKSSVGIFFAEVNRSGRNRVDPSNTDTSSDEFLSENRKVQADNDLALGENHTMKLGLQWRNESGYANSMFNGVPSKVSRKDQSVFGSALTYLYESETWFGDVGVRSDNSSTADEIQSYRISFGRVFAASKMKAYVSYGTGFKLPSLYQLYSAFGDENLKHEFSHTYEATIENVFGDSNIVSATFFDSHFQDLIDYDSGLNRYFNVSKAKGQGFEVNSDFALSTASRFIATYTYVDSEDESTGFGLLRRPKNSWTMTLKRTNQKFDYFAEYRFNGKRPDVDPTTFQRITAKSYDIISVGASYGLNSNFRVTARIENIFDRKYEEVAGFGTAERSFFAGLIGEL